MVRGCCFWWALLFARRKFPPKHRLITAPTRSGVRQNAAPVAQIIPAGSDPERERALPAKIALFVMAATRAAEKPGRISRAPSS